MLHYITIYSISALNISKLVFKIRASSIRFHIGFIKPNMKLLGLRCHIRTLGLNIRAYNVGLNIKVCKFGFIIMVLILGSMLGFIILVLYC